MSGRRDKGRSPSNRKVRPAWTQVVWPQGAKHGVNGHGLGVREGQAASETTPQKAGGPR